MDDICRSVELWMPCRIIVPTVSEAWRAPKQEKQRLSSCTVAELGGVKQLERDMLVDVVALCGVPWCGCRVQRKAEIRIRSSESHNLGN